MATVRLRLATLMAADMPAGPDPTTMTSNADSPVAGSLTWIPSSAAPSHGRPGLASQSTALDGRSRKRGRGSPRRRRRMRTSGSGEPSLCDHRLPVHPPEVRGACPVLPSRSRGGELSVSPTASSSRRSRLPVSFLQGLRPVGKGRVPAEALAGVTLAALAIPEVMGYTKIAGMPVVTGLYTILVPLAVFAVLGSSRHLVVGADSATAAIMFAALDARSPRPALPSTSRSPACSPLMAGVLLLLARILRLGFLANFLSRTVLIGFLTGVGIRVACGELGGMFGYPARRPGAGGRGLELGQGPRPHQPQHAGGLRRRAAHDGARPQACAPGALGADRRHRGDRRQRGASLSAHGVATLGAVPGGLPQLGWPGIPAGDFASSGCRGALHLRRHPGAERRHVARLRGQVRRRVRRERRPRRPGRGQHRRRPHRHVRRQRQPDQDGDGRRRRRPQPARAARHRGRRPRRAALPHEAARATCPRPCWPRSCS